jgi:hypothetical protein
VGGADQDGEEADGLGGLLLAEGDEVWLCQLDPLVVHTITGRLLLTKPIPSNPVFVVSRSGRRRTSGSPRLLLLSRPILRGASPHSLPIESPPRAWSQREAAFVEGEKTWSPGKTEGDRVETDVPMARITPQSLEMAGTRVEALGGR